MRSDRWRYIRYEDNTEELYDRDKDPMEWTNLAGDPQYAGVKKDLAKYLPTDNVADAPEGTEVGEVGALGWELAEDLPRRR